MNLDTLLTGWRWQALLLSIVIGIGGYLLFSLWAGWDEVLRAFAAAGWLGMAAVLGMSLINYALRLLRWQMYLRTLGHVLAPAANVRIYLAGFALTTTPGKAGEAVRGLLLRPHGVPWSDSFAALFSERLSDLLAVIMLALTGLLLYPPAQGLVLPAVALVIVIHLLLMQRSLLLSARNRVKGYGRIGWLVRQVAGILLASRSCLRPTVLLSASALSLVAWAAEAFAFHWLLVWMGFEVSLTFAVFVYAISMLAGALSFMPGGLGGAEAAMAGLLVWQGMPLPDAIAATVLIRLATLWFAVLIGLIALSGSRIRSQQQL